MDIVSLRREAPSNYIVCPSVRNYFSSLSAYCALEYLYWTNYPYICTSMGKYVWTNTFSKREWERESALTYWQYQNKLSLHLSTPFCQSTIIYLFVFLSFYVYHFLTVKLSFFLIIHLSIYLSNFFLNSFSLYIIIIIFLKFHIPLHSPHTRHIPSLLPTTLPSHFRILFCLTSPLIGSEASLCVCLSVCPCGLVGRSVCRHNFLKRRRRVSPTCSYRSTFFPHSDYDWQTDTGKVIFLDAWIDIS